MLPICHEVLTHTLSLLPSFLNFVPNHVFPAICQNGCGGLLMRLRGEGHEQLHVVAPPGAGTLLHSLRHFVQWRHPRVLVTETAAVCSNPYVYEVTISKRGTTTVPALTASHMCAGYCRTQHRCVNAGCKHNSRAAAQRIHGQLAATGLAVPH